jgi:hypothetical protein
MSRRPYFLDSWLINGGEWRMRWAGIDYTWDRLNGELKEIETTWKAEVDVRIILKWFLKK